MVRVGRLDGIVLQRNDAYQLPYKEVMKSPVEWDARAREVLTTRYTVAVPFTGDEALLWMRPDVPSLPAPTVEVRDHEILLSQDAEHGPTSARVISATLNSLIAQIEQIFVLMNRDIDKHNTTIASWIPGAVAARRAKILADRQTQAAIGFPLKTRNDPVTYVAPIRPRQLTPASPSLPRTQAFTPEPVLDDADYEEALRVLSNCRNALERSPSTAAKLDEENIRDILLIGLNSRFEGTAAGEVFNGAGKTDILIRARDRNIFIGECKFWHGPSKFTEAIDQLLSYTTWRDTKAALLIFVRARDVTAITEKAIATLAAHPNFKRDGTRATEDRHDVVLHAVGDPQREIKVALMLFLVPDPPPTGPSGH